MSPGLEATDHHAPATSAGHRLTIEQHDFAAAQRRAILATLSQSGSARLVPICFVLADPSTDPSSTLLYSPLDEKPKQTAAVRELARVRDIARRPEVTLLFERWSEDWSELAWLRVRGLAELIEPSSDPVAHRHAVEALRDKHPQYRAQRIERSPMIRVAIREALAWSATTLAHVETSPSRAG